MVLLGLLIITLFFIGNFSPPKQGLNAYSSIWKNSSDNYNKNIFNQESYLELCNNPDIESFSVEEILPDVALNKVAFGENNAQT